MSVVLEEMASHSPAVVLQNQLPVYVSLRGPLANQTLASMEPLQVQQEWFRKFGVLGRPFEMLFLLLAIYPTGGKTVKSTLAHGSKSLLET